MHHESRPRDVRQAGPCGFQDFSGLPRGHRRTLISHDDYLRQCIAEGWAPSAVFQCPGFLLEYVMVDSMHAGDLGAPAAIPYSVVVLALQTLL